MHVRISDDARKHVFEHEIKSPVGRKIPLVKDVNNGGVSKFHCVPQVVLLSAASFRESPDAPERSSTMQTVPRQSGASPNDHPSPPG